MKETFYTAARSIQIINKVKDSKFFGSISRADTREEAVEFINKIKEMYRDATHNVSAYIIGNAGQEIKYADDDGEPAGSSGPPVLQAIEGAELTNTVIVVTRYFGGTKLGIGGLIRAYGDTARMAIAEAGRQKLSLFYKLEISTNYNFIGTVLGQVEAYQAELLDTRYTNDGVFICVLLSPEKKEALIKTLIEKTGNQVQAREIGHLYR